jgi:hypothetical protein
MVGSGYNLSIESIKLVSRLYVGYEEGKGSKLALKFLAYETEREKLNLLS